MIKSIVRDWGTEPAIVRIATTDTYEVISAPGYITAQAANIALANNGPFEWALSDSVLCWYQNDAGVGAWAFFSISPDFTSLNPLSGSVNSTILLTAAEVLAMFATPQLLVPAPGAGKALMVTNAQIVTEPVTPFAGGGAAIVQYGNAIHGAGTDALAATIPAAEITAATAQIYTVQGYGSGTVSTGITDTGLYFSNATAAFTGGADSTVSVVLQYQVIDATV